MHNLPINTSKYIHSHYKPDALFSPESISVKCQVTVIPYIQQHHHQDKLFMWIFGLFFMTLNAVFAEHHLPGMKVRQRTDLLRWKLSVLLKGKLSNTGVIFLQMIWECGLKIRK